MAYAGRLRIASAILDDNPLLGEQYGVRASPTILAFQHGDVEGQAVGFLPIGLLRLLADALSAGVLTGGVLWSPVEEDFENAVLIPMLTGQDFAVERQVACRLVGGRRGRIDLLVYRNRASEPLTLIESKRHINDSYALGHAVAQAAGYANSLALPAFVVAAPRGAWLYQSPGPAGSPTCMVHLSSLDLHHDPLRLPHLIAELSG